MLQWTRTVRSARDFAAVPTAVIWNSLPTTFQVASLTVAMFSGPLKAYWCSVSEDFLFCTIQIYSLLLARLHSVGGSIVLLVGICRRLSSLTLQGVAYAT